MEWCTNAENNRHAWENGLNKNIPRKVKQYDLQGNFIKEWEHAQMAGEQLKINFRNINACCRGVRHRPTAGGYIWRFVEEDL